MTTTQQSARYIRTSYVRSSPPVGHRGGPRDAAEVNRIVAAMGDARQAFKDATSNGDMGAVVRAEMDRNAAAQKLREMLASEVLRPDLQPFTEAEIESCVEAVRRFLEREIAREWDEEAEE